MRVLVTGGAGYIGSVVTEVLLSEGHQAVVLDNLSKGHADAVPRGVPFHNTDLRDVGAVRAVLENERVDAVVHMAADSLVGESVHNPAKYYENNVVAGLNLLNAMRATDVRYIVFSSTAAVYGEPEKQPITEDAPQTPTNPYGASKLAFEQALHWYDRAYGTRYVSLRYFNAAGATRTSGERHDPETHLIPLALQAARGERDALTVFGRDYPTRDGTCLRDYIHVVDLARAHVQALVALRGGAASNVFNLGCGGEGYSVLEVVESVRRVTGREVPLVFGERRPGDPAVLIASSDRIVAELGWKPERQNLDDIVRSAWEFMDAPAPAEARAVR